MKVLNFFLNLLLAINVSTAQQLAVNFDAIPASQSAVDRVYSAILCEKDGHFYDIIDNENVCRDAIVFGHSLCYEGIGNEVTQLINEDFYSFNGFAYFSSARTFNNDSVLFQLNLRRSFREVLLPSCHFYLENL